MSLVLNTNISSLNAQQNLTNSQASLATSMQRLSSGLRINSAADDAAGLAISSQFTTQINGTNQAINNANDAVSEAQTAGGALATLTNSLQSIRTLAVEAANGSNSSADRQALDQQVQQQIAEVTQIASQTNFNGSNVLDGTSGVTTFQVGANVGNTVSINLSQGVRADQIGQVASLTQSVTTTGFAGGLTIAVGTGAAVTLGTSAAGSLPGQTAGSAYAKAQTINAGNISGLTASATNVVTAAFSSVANTSTTAAATYDLAINGVNIYAGASNVAVSSTLTAAQVATQINLYSSQDGNVTAVAGTSGITLTAQDGSDIAIQQSGSNAAGFTTATNASATIGATAVVNSGQLTLSADSNIAVGSTSGGTADLTASGFSAGNISLSAATLASQNVLTVGGANATIQAVDAALQTVSSFNSELGAIQNRFTAAVSNLTSTSQNLTQSRSTLQDTDFAAETANMTQANVLEQAGISVLAQANQQPQLILKLLQ
jgi:flagellin